MAGVAFRRLAQTIHRRKAPGVAAFLPGCRAGKRFSKSLLALFLEGINDAVIQLLRT